MAHVREETVLGFVEHLDLAVLFCRGVELLMETVPCIEHRNAHCDLEDREYDEVTESYCVICQTELRCNVEQEDHSRI